MQTYIEVPNNDGREAFYEIDVAGTALLQEAMTELAALRERADGSFGERLARTVFGAGAQPDDAAIDG